MMGSKSGPFEQGEFTFQVHHGCCNARPAPGHQDPRPDPGHVTPVMPAVMHYGSSRGRPS